MMIEYSLTQEDLDKLLQQFMEHESTMDGPMRFPDYILSISHAEKYHAFRKILIFSDESYLNFFLLRL